MTLHIASVDVNEAISASVERARITSRRHVITTNLDPDLAHVWADSDRILQVITNLLSNAVKYSPKGGEVVVTSRSSGNQVEISVRDEGVGIPPDFVDRLFGRYERYENEATSKIVGTGLGLAITRRIVEMHGGRIWFESTPGDGSEFFFTVPVPTNGVGLHAKRAETVAIAVPV